MLTQQVRAQSATAKKTGLSFLLILNAPMAVTSLSTDIYLPAMPVMAKDLQGDAELTITGFAGSASALMGAVASSLRFFLYCSVTEHHGRWAG